jgi:hypothetical protein
LPHKILDNTARIYYAPLVLSKSKLTRRLK